MWPFTRRAQIEISLTCFKCNERYLPSIGHECKPEAAPEPVDLTEEAFGYWLRACQPQPLPWFLELEEAVQATLAALGDEYMESVVIAVGYAVADPQLAEAGIDGLGDEKAAAIIARRVAEALVAKRTQGRPAARPGSAPVKGPTKLPESHYENRPTTMAGVIQRAQEASSKAKTGE